MKKHIQLLSGTINCLTLSFLILVLLNTNVAFAYIDPGTGSFILQSILAVIATIAFYFGYPIRAMKSFFNKLLNKKKIIKNDKDKIN